MKVRYTSTALAEIDEILSYIAKDNPLAAHEVSVILREAIDRLASFPHLAIETDVAGVRMAPVLPYRYLVFYALEGEAVLIRNVRHAARNRPW
jgi:toxin ParE1/3/4